MRPLPSLVTVIFLVACGGTPAAPADGGAADGAALDDAASGDADSDLAFTGMCSPLGVDCHGPRYCCDGLGCDTSIGRCITLPGVAVAAPMPPPGAVACADRTFNASDVDAACAMTGATACDRMTGESGRVAAWCTATDVYVYVKLGAYAMTGAGCPAATWTGWQSGCTLDGTGCTFPSPTSLDGAAFALDATIPRDPARHGAVALRIALSAYASCPGEAPGAPGTVLAVPDPGLVLP